MQFLYWLYGIGIFIAVCQDIKRREVDNWLNLLLLISGSVFVIFNSSSVAEIFILIFTILFFFILSHAMYFARFFAGGDAKLLFAMAPMFVALTFNQSLINSGVFLFLLLISGSIYGLAYSLVLGIKHFGDMKKVFPEEARKINFMYVVLSALILIVSGIFVFPLFLLGVFTLVFAVLFVFAKSLERSAMYRQIDSSSLREGDWLVKDIKIGKKVIRANFDGLNLEDIELIKKHKKNILIKGGLPFVPAFVLAFIAYVIWKDFFVWIISLIL